MDKEEIVREQMVVNIADYRKDREYRISPAMEKMLAAFPDAIEKSEGWWAHPDDPKFDFREREDGSIFIHPWTGRDWREIAALGEISIADLFPKGYTNPRTASRISVFEMSHKKCIPWEFLFSEGIHDGYRYDGYNHLKITYFLSDGSPHTKVRLRKRISGESNYIWDKHTPGSILPYGLHRHAMWHQAGYLLMGEGETDAWACWYHNIPYLGIPGADNHNCLKNMDVNLLPPEIYVLAEPDQVNRLLSSSTRSSGFYSNIHRALREIGYTGKISYVNFEQVTGYKDPSDLHIALWGDHQAQKFHTSIDQIREKSIPANDGEEKRQEIYSTLESIVSEEDPAAVYLACNDLALLSKTDYAILKTRIKEKFGKKVNLNDLDRAVSEHKKKLSGIGVEEKLDLDYVASVFAERHRDDWRYDTNLQVWKKWVGTHWSEMMNDDDSKSELDLIIVDILHEFDFEVTRNGTLDCVQRLIKAKCKKDFKPTPRRVNFLDGTLNIDTEQLDPHDRDDNLPYCLEYPYESDYALTNTLAFYASVLCYPERDENGNKVPDWCAIQSDMAYTGLALIRDMSMHHAEIVKGPPRAGKTTLMRHKNAVCGVIDKFAENTEARYGNFGGDDLFSSELEGKRSRYVRNSQRIVCCDELSPGVFKKEEEMLKNMTGHSGVPMRGMLKNEVQDNTWGPKVVMSTNNLPYYKDTSGGIRERLIYVQTPFRLEPKDRDPELLGKLLAERSTFARVCIKLGKEMIKQRRFPQSSAMKELAGYAETNGNTLKSFIDERCVLEKTTLLPKSKLYDAFNLYRGENGNTKDYSLPTMTANFRDMDIGVHDSNNKTTRYKGYACKCFFGIRLKTDEELEREADGQGHTLADDPLLVSLEELGWCNQDVTNCNQDVTVEVTISDSPTGGSTNGCNFVTKKEEKLSYEDTHTTTHEEVKGTRYIEGIHINQNPVTELHVPQSQPVAPQQGVTNASKSELQSGYKQVTLDDLDVGF